MKWALAGRAHWAAALLDCTLPFYFHVMMWRKQVVNIMSLGSYFSDFLCPVGGAVDMTQF